MRRREKALQWVCVMHTDYEKKCAFIVSFVGHVPADMNVKHGWYAELNLVAYGVFKCRIESCNGRLKMA